MQLKDIARVIRSKNAGPRTTTLDIIFSNLDDFERARASGALNVTAMSVLYQVDATKVKVIEYPLGYAIKVVIPRRLTAGDPGDRDVYGAQQHRRLLGIELRAQA
jgi:hypothetical protein